MLAGVHFMAETAKLLNPAKTVLIPDLRRRLLAGRVDHRRGRARCCEQRYPGVPVVTYVNTSAAVKAESDICCTSGNAAEGGRERSASPRVIMIPDEFLARNIAAQTDVEIITWPGHCEVHERFTAAGHRRLPRRPSRASIVLAHPECPPEVVAVSDFAGSTAAMIDYVGQQRPPTAW